MPFRRVPAVAAEDGHPNRWAIEVKSPLPWLTNRLAKANLNDSMPPVFAEAVSPRNRSAKSEKEKPIPAPQILETIEQHVLLDGFKIVVDLDKSRGSYLHNAVDNRRLIDMYGFFGSMPVGFNHPHFDVPEVRRDLGGALGETIRGVRCELSTAAHFWLAQAGQEQTSLLSPQLNYGGRNHEKNALDHRLGSSGVVCVGTDHTAAAYEDARRAEAAAANHKHDHRRY